MNEYDVAFSLLDPDSELKFAVRDAVMAQALAKLRTLELVYSLDSELDIDSMQTLFAVTPEEIYGYFAFRRILTDK